MTALPSEPRTVSPLSFFFSTEILYGSTSLAFVCGLKFLNHALRYEKDREHRAERQQQIIADAHEVTQKLPSVLAVWRATPRTSAAARPTPTAAETKL